jgi:hypothetical protein
MVVAVKDARDDCAPAKRYVPGAVTGHGLNFCIPAYGRDATIFDRHGLSGGPLGIKRVNLAVEQNQVWGQILCFHVHSPDIKT